MKVIDLLKKKQTLSFEFFPPKTDEQEKQLFETIEVLKEFKPDFASVTYGALGTTRAKTFFWAEKIKREFGIEPVAHLTCIAATRGNIRQQLDEIEKLGIENVLALRGDPPAEVKDFQPPPDGFRFANELIAFIKQAKPSLCLGAAGFPEGHPATGDINKDIEYLRAKIETGAEYVITQLFFDNQFYFKYLEKCRRAGITVPVVPGIMPIVSFKQITRMTQICGAKIPEPIFQRLVKYQHDKEAILEIGVELAIKQCRELMNNDVPGIHFFVMNQAGPISAILKEIK